MRPRDRQAMRPLGFFAGHLAVGLAGALAFFALILASDLFGLRRLLAADGEGWLAAGLLLFGLVVTFSSAAMAIGILTLGPWRDSPPLDGEDGGDRG